MTSVTPLCDLERLVSLACSLLVPRQCHPNSPKEREKKKDIYRLKEWERGRKKGGKREREQKVSSAIPSALSKSPGKVGQLPVRARSLACHFGLRNAFSQQPHPPFSHWHVEHSACSSSPLTPVHDDRGETASHSTLDAVSPCPAISCKNNIILKSRFDKATFPVRLSAVRRESLMYGTRCPGPDVWQAGVWV